MREHAFRLRLILVSKLTINIFALEKEGYMIKPRTGKSVYSGQDV